VVMNIKQKFIALNLWNYLLSELFTIHLYLQQLAICVIV